MSVATSLRDAWASRVAATAREARCAATAEQFRRAHLATNQPCILDEDATGTKEWTACKEWREKTRKDEQVDASRQSGASAAPVTAVAGITHTAAADVFTPESVHALLIESKCVVAASLSSTTSSSSSSSSSRLPPPRSAVSFDSLQRVFGGLQEEVLVARVFADERETSTQDGQQQHQQQQTTAYGYETCGSSMDAFLDHWRAQRASRGDGHADRADLQYLKDFHLALQYPHYSAYTTPPHFLDDWMNHDHIHAGDEDTISEAAAAGRDDFRFCYLGAEGTWTSIHSDVYHSYSWSANVVGRKLWIMFAPEWRPILTQDGQLMRDALNISSTDPSDLSLTLPRLIEAASAGGDSAPSLPPIYSWIQEEGEIIFVPSGWLHQVHNLDDCASINHNWMNAHNLHAMYAFLTSEWREALDSVQGFDFDAGVTSITSNAHEAASQTTSANGASDPLVRDNAWIVMRASTGMTWDEFERFLQTHAARFERMRTRHATARSPSEPHAFTLPLDVVEFSLAAIKVVQTSLESDGILALIAARQADAASSLEQGTTADQATSSDRDVDDNNDDSDSEAEFPLRRTAERKRRKRIIRDDDDDEEANEDWCEVAPVSPEPDAYEANSLTAVEEPPSLESLVLSVTPQEQDRAQDSDLTPSEACTLPLPVSLVTPVPPLAVAAMPPVLMSTLHFAPNSPVTSPSVGDADELLEYAPSKALSALLHLLLQDLHAPLGLPFIDTGIIDTISAYAVPPPRSVPTLHTVIPATVAVASPASRGPWFVVLTHYANGDTFSEEYADELELLDGVAEYVRGCRARVDESGVESDAEVSQQLDHLDAALHAQREHTGGDATDDERASWAQHLDHLMQLALTVGDEMIAGQLGYGWTHVHECNEGR